MGDTVTLPAGAGAGAGRRPRRPGSVRRADRLPAPAPLSQVALGASRATHSAGRMGGAGGEVAAFVVLGFCKQSLGR